MHPVGWRKLAAYFVKRIQQGAANIQSRRSAGDPSIHRSNKMAKVLVLYHSVHGHIETMAQAIAAGAREAKATVDIKRVTETIAEEVRKKIGAKHEIGRGSVRE